MPSERIFTLLTMNLRFNLKDRGTGLGKQFVLQQLVEIYDAESNDIIERKWVDIPSVTDENDAQR